MIEHNTEGTTQALIEALFTPGERLGWTFRDRNIFRRPFPEPPPQAPWIPPQALAAAARARDGLLWGLWRVIYITALIAAPILCLGAFLNFRLDFLALVAVVIMQIPIAFVVTRYALTRFRPQRIQRQHQRALAAWQSRLTHFDQAEWHRVAPIQEWGPAIAPTGNRRIDVIGGDPRGWRALLTIFGASTLATGKSLTLIDLSGQQVSWELLTLAADRGYTIDTQVLPTDLPDSDLLTGLNINQIVDVLVESIHGGSIDIDRRERSTRDETSDRTVDHRILTTLCTQLGDHVSIARLVDAIKALMGEPSHDETTLTPAERANIQDNLFSTDYRRQAHHRLQQLDAYLHPLQALGQRRHPRPPTSLACIDIDIDSPTTRHELLDDLLVQWLTQQIATSPDQPRTVVIAGADGLAARHLESLSDLCSRRNVRLMLMFRHLRDTALRILGSGPVAFMRLGNHEQATRAADFIGRQHKFVFTQLSRSIGGTTTHNESISGDIATSPMIRLTRHWTTTATMAENLQWNQETTTGRVYEYTVEPNILQTLPDYGLLLIEQGHRSHIVKAIECNPGISTLPRIGPQPLSP